MTRREKSPRTAASTTWPKERCRLRIISARSLEEPPSTLTKLRRLTTVSISDWNLPTAPSVLLQMPWLRTVTIFARVRMDPASERALRGAIRGLRERVRAAEAAPGG